MARTDPVTLPLLMDQPVGRRIGEIWTDNAERFACDEPRFFEQFRAPGRR